MQAYIAKRLLLFIPSVLLVTLMVFALIRLLPGDPALNLLAGEEGDGQFTRKAEYCRRHGYKYSQIQRNNNARQ